MDLDERFEDARPSGVYGIKGIPAAANVPGARENSVAWTDSAGDLWLFGGYGRDSTGKYGRLNDLWRYDPDTNQWTWMSGSKTRDQVGIYGIKGIPDAANVPGARSNSVAWAGSAGNLWLFGGSGYDSASVNGWLNDLWAYELPPECLSDSHCDEGYMCVAEMCVEI